MLLVTATMQGHYETTTRTEVVPYDQLLNVVAGCLHDTFGVIHSITVVRLTDEDIKEFNEAKAKE